MRDPNQLLRKKKDKIDPEQFNFVENLLIFRVKDDLKVPKESGRQFRISKSPTDSCLCLLVHIDHPTDPIFEAGEKRPDYLTVYLKGRTCICSIIEMKGKTLHEQVKGVDQIVSLARRLREDIVKLLPPGFNVDIQGILLTAENAGPIEKKIAAEKEFVVKALFYHQCFELLPYITRKLRRDEPGSIGSYEHLGIRTPADPSKLETMLAKRALPRRVFVKVQGKEEGLHIDYVFPDSKDVVSFIASPDKMQFVAQNPTTNCVAALSAQLASAGLACPVNVSTANDDAALQVQP